VLAIAPSGAWIAIQGSLTLVPVLLSLSVLLWSAGFDVLYACQDYDSTGKAGFIRSRVDLGSAPRYDSPRHTRDDVRVARSVFLNAHLGWLGLME